MLKIDKLEEEIKKAFEETIPMAMERTLQMTFPKDSKVGDKMAKEYGDLMCEMIAGPLAKRLAAAIDYHVRSAEIYGTLITTGAPTTHFCTISSPAPLTNGKVPNSLGIR